MDYFGHIFTADQKTSGFGGTHREFHQVDLFGGHFASGIFLAPQINGIGSGGEQFQFASRRAEHILFFQNESADAGAFAVIFAAFGLFVDHTELSFRIVFAEIIQFADKKFIRYHRNNFVFTIFFHTQQTVIFIADDGIIAFDTGADISVFAIPADFDIVQCGGFTVDLFDFLDFGAAREIGTVFLFDICNDIDGVIDQMGQFMADILDFFIDFPEFLLVFLNIETGDAAHRQGEQFINILVGDIPHKQVAVGEQAAVDFLILLFLTAALFDLFVDTVFKEKLSERFGVAQLILFIKIDFQLLFQIADQFGGIAPQNFTYGHLYRFAVTDDNDAG